jgi:hypothetical protein
MSKQAQRGIRQESCSTRNNRKETAPRDAPSVQFFC